MAAAGTAVRLLPCWNSWQQLGQTITLQEQLAAAVTAVRPLPCWNSRQQLGQLSQIAGCRHIDRFIHI